MTGPLPATVWGIQLRDIAREITRRPFDAVLLFAAIQVAVWTVVPALTSHAPPLDVVEGLLWGQEWPLGTHKHPPLPPILLEIARLATGSPIWGPYLLSQLSMAATYVLVFMTGRLFSDARNALAGTLVLPAIYYFTWPTPEFNHNVAQLPVWAGLIYLFARLRKAEPTDSPVRLWLALGLVAGIGLYVKYSVVVLYAVIAGWLLFDRHMRPALRTPWPWLAALLAIAIAVPHLLWLKANGYAPLFYAGERSAADMARFGSFGFILTQIANHAPLIVFFALVGIGRIRALPRLAKAPAATAQADLRFLSVMALGPFVLVVILSLFAGMALKDMWGMPMFTMSGLLIVLIIGRHWNEAVLTRSFVVACAFVIAIGLGYGLRDPVSRLAGERTRTAWPMREIADLADRTWTKATGAPLKIVSGPMWIAGLISAGSPDHPHVVYDGSLALSPWLTEGDLARDGVLYVWMGGHVPDFVVEPGIIARGAFTIRDGTLGDLTIDYAIRPPAPSTAPSAVSGSGAPAPAANAPQTTTEPET